jgi:hypothetical protein
VTRTLLTGGLVFGGRHLPPGLFDCHTHVTPTSINLLGIVQTPFSYRFYETVQNLRLLAGAGGVAGPDPGRARRGAGRGRGRGADPRRRPAQGGGVADELGTLEPGSGPTWW